MRVVFDVNVLTRACLESALANRLLGYCGEEPHRILVTRLLVEEFAQTVRKPRLAGRVDWRIYNQTLGLLESAGEEVLVQPPFPECRDAKDRYLLAMADIGNADYLVTLDGDLLVLGSIGPCRIVTPEELDSILSSNL